jgi:hypothetical protein
MDGIGPDDGYGSGIWRPFPHQAHGMPMVFAYLGSVFTVLAASATIIIWLNRPIPVPHTLYYLVSVTLPFMWRSGFILVPLVILLTGLLTCRTTTDPFRHAKRISGTDF